MAKVIIEISHTNWSNKEYKTFDTAFITIGRGYHNDLIISDPHVSDKHLSITQDQEGWFVENLDSENGLFLNKKSTKVKKTRLKSGDRIIIGKTYLRILSPQHPISKTKLLIQTNKFLKRLNYPVNMWSIFFVLFTLYALETYIHSPENFPIQRLVLSSIGFFFLAVFWGGIWAFVGRTIHKKPKFFFQVAVSSLYIVCFIPLANISAYAGYYTSSNIVEGIFYAVLLGGLFSWLLSSNLAVATNITKKNRIIVSILIPVIIISIGALTYFAFKDEFNPNLLSYSTLKPPLIKPLNSKSIDEFLKKSSEIFK